jgi:hypothetical protein
MSARTTNRDEVPREFATLKEAGEFWDVHDSGDYEDLMVPVEIEMDASTDRIYMAIAKDVAEQLRTKAREQGVSAETLVNLWLQERLLQSA